MIGGKIMMDEKRDIKILNRKDIDMEEKIIGNEKIIEKRIKS